MTAALLAEADEELPRLYSKGYEMRVPVEEVAPEHAKVHELLVRWGRWAGSRGRRVGLVSIEAFYTKGGTPPATAPLGADPLLMEVERAVLRMPSAHRNTIRMIYVYRWSPSTVCGAVKPRLRYEAWPEWARTCRCMVVNLLRQAGTCVTR